MKNTMANIHIEDCSKLELHIHIIGHYPKGESILVILWDGNDNSVLQSILIDSYQTKKGNIAYDLLKEYSIDKNKLNYFVWTHPDLDHSTGIPTIIDNFANKNTRYIVPVGLTSKVFKKLSGTLFKAWCYIKTRPKYTVSPVSRSILYSNTPNICQYFDDGISDKVKFSLEIIAPLSEISFNETEIKKKIYKNDISVAFNIVFGQLRFFFGGEITNTSIRKIPNDYFQNTVFVKIPHHGSSTSNILIDKYKNINHDLIEVSNPIIAVSTIFEDHPTHLPETNVLDSYRTISNGILVTNNTTNNKNDIGIWSLKYKLNSQKVSYEPISKGDAYIYK